MNKERYSRQLLLPEVGEDGQKKLREAKVLIIGAGGLGSPIALYLTAAGVGNIGIAEDDLVNESNLNRQILYTELDLGQSKTACAADRIRALNTELNVHVFAERVTERNAEYVIRNYDVVIDACDNFATRYLVGDATAKLGIPYVYGAVSGFEGQVSVFNYGEHPRKYRDLWPDEEMKIGRASCRERVSSPV